MFYYPLWTHTGCLPKTFPELKWNSSSFSGERSTIKGFTVGTTIHARHPGSLCLLFQATAPPDRPPAPASSLIQNTSLWFPATDRSLRLNLSAFCPFPPLLLLLQLIYPWVIAVVWTGDQEGADGWIRLETGMELNPRVKGSLDANRYKISWLNYVPKLPSGHFLVGGERESKKPGCTIFFKVRGTGPSGAKSISHVHPPLKERLRREARHRRGKLNIVFQLSF